MRAPGSAPVVCALLLLAALGAVGGIFVTDVF
jgi:hypothetical protein